MEILSGLSIYGFDIYPREWRQFERLNEQRERKLMAGDSTSFDALLAFEASCYVT